MTNTFGGTTVITDAVIQTTAYAAELRGRINPGNSPGDWYFEYALDSMYTDPLYTPATVIPPGSDTVQVASVVQGLAPSSIYFYRLICGTEVGLTRIVRTSGVSYNGIELSLGDQSAGTRPRPRFRDFNQFSPGRSPSLYDAECIGQGINNIMTCRPGARFFKNGFGSYIDELPFELNNDALVETALGYLIDPISEWEPRATIDIAATTMIQAYDDHVFDMRIGFSTVLDGNDRIYQANIRGITGG